MKSRSAHKIVSTVSEREVAQFSAQAGDWWDEQGSFRPLHKLNPVRMAYVRSQICAHFGRDVNDKKDFRVFQGLTILDIGCGGGLLAEPMARLGGKVTGVDASDAAIKVATAHARTAGLTIDYQCTSAEALATQGKRYDVITALEIAEHVADLDAFIVALKNLLNPGGLLIMSTLNRTPKSFLLGIVAAEYILRWVPRGTHRWRQFIRPSELVQKLEVQSLRAANITGLIFNPLTGVFALSDNDLEVNYLLTAVSK